MKIEPVVAVLAEHRPIRRQDARSTDLRPDKGGFIVGKSSDGTYADKKSLADALGLSAVYLGRVLRLASLSPRIVEKVMSGELNVSVTQLMEITTPIWTEQHRQLGLPM